MDEHSDDGTDSSDRVDTPDGTTEGDDAGTAVGLVGRVTPSIVARRYAAKFALAFALVVVLITVVGVGSYVQTQAAVEADETAHLRSEASLRADAAAQWDSTMTTQTVALSATDVYATDDPARIQRYLEDVAAGASGTVLGLHYVDTSESRARVTASTEPSLRGRAVDAAVPAWQPLVDGVDGADTGAVARSDTAYETDDGQAMAFTSPVAGADGVLVLSSRVPGPFRSPTDSTGAAAALVVTADGTPVFGFSDGGITALVDEASASAAVGGTATTTEAGTWVLAYAPVDGTDWATVTATQQASVFHVSRLVRRTVAVIVGTAIVSLGFVGVVLGRQTITPLVRLRERTQEMEQGNLDVDLSTTREDEIGRLYDSFANMRDALREQIREAHEAREAAERSKQELERQNSRLDEFASTLSHDLRNPLTVARGHVDLLATRLDGLADDGVDVSAFDPHVEKLAQSHDRIESIIQDVLTLTRKGASVEETETVSLSGVVEEAWANVDSGDGSVTVVESRTFEADRSRLLRALENLFRNAIDHVGADVAVGVGLTNDGFYVADDGPGIPIEEVDDVFDYGHTTSDDGTGLGLSIVNTITEAHGWRLYVDTTYEDGAMFVFAHVFDESDQPLNETAFERGATDDD